MPVFTYTSICCSSPASKTACEKPKAGKTTGKGKSKTTEYATLGKWNCEKCGKGCKVSRSGGANAQG